MRLQSVYLRNSGIEGTRAISAAALCALSDGGIAEEKLKATIQIPGTNRAQCQLLLLRHSLRPHPLTARFFDKVALLEILVRRSTAAQLFYIGIYLAGTDLIAGG